MCDFLQYIIYACAVVGAVGLITFFIPHIYQLFLFKQDLRAKYNTEWALVTGASSGIGLSIAKRLAGQGINVIVVAYPDKAFEAAKKDLPLEFPSVKFRFLGVDLGTPGYREVIEKETKGIDIGLVFLNAGYIVTQFFHHVSWSRHAANIECNSTSTVGLAHIFVPRLLTRNVPEGGRKGALFFTSSPAGYMPAPFSALYGTTKAAITEFAASLAAELRHDGVDVCVVEPSPTATAFYAGALPMPTLKFFESTASGPEKIADSLIRGVGRVVIVNQGYYSFGMGLLMRFVDFSFIADMIARSSHRVADYQMLKDAASQNEKKKI